MAYEFGADDDSDLDEILLAGEDDDDDFSEPMELGAARRRGHANARSHAMVKQVAYTRERNLICGLGSVVVGASSTASLTVSPQTPFRVERIILSATSLAGLLVTDVRVGKNSQLVSGDSLAAIAFQDTTVGSRVSFDAAGPGTNIRFDFLDTSALANTVSGTLFGRAAER